MGLPTCFCGRHVIIRVESGGVLRTDAALIILINSQDQRLTQPVILFFLCKSQDSSMIAQLPHTVSNLSTAQIYLQHWARVALCGLHCGATASCTAKSVLHSAALATGHNGSSNTATHAEHSSSNSGSAHCAQLEVACCLCNSQLHTQQYKMSKLQASMHEPASPELQSESHCELE